MQNNAARCCRRGSPWSDLAIRKQLALRVWSPSPIDRTSVAARRMHLLPIDLVENWF